MAAKHEEFEYGFVGTGAVTRTFLPTLEVLQAELGPVYSPAKRATPRLVTALGGGFPVATMEALAGCHHLLVCAPVEETAQLLEEALQVGALARVQTLALIENSAAYVPHADIAAKVREVGGLSKLPVRREPTYLIEGSLRFRNFCQQLTGAPLRRLVCTRRESRAMVEAAVFMASEFCQPLFEAIQNCMELSGLATDHARELTAELLEEAIVDSRHAGRKRWTGILQSEDGHRFSGILEALQQENELLANLVYNYAQHGLAAMGRSTQWLPSIEGQPDVGTRLAVNGRSGIVDVDAATPEAS